MSDAGRVFRQVPGGKAERMPLPEVPAWSEVITWEDGTHVFKVVGRDGKLLMTIRAAPPHAPREYSPRTYWQLSAALWLLWVVLVGAMAWSVVSG